MNIFGKILCALGIHKNHVRGVPYPVLCQRCFTQPHYEFKKAKV